ncbi:hypothetical protein ACHAXS_006884, partial [Conticribra weissflogii]
FWHPQRDFKRLRGVEDCVVGYCGGQKKNPTYRNIMDSTESYIVEFDPSIISYEEILNEWADMHSPYYPSKTQYRSAIFYTSNKQREAALKKVQDLSKNGSKKVYVDVEPVTSFYRGEEYHQDFLDKQTSTYSSGL